MSSNWKTFVVPPLLRAACADTIGRLGEYGFSALTLSVTLSQKASRLEDCWLLHQASAPASVPIRGRAENNQIPLNDKKISKASPLRQWWLVPYHRSSFCR